MDSWIAQGYQQGEDAIMEVLDEDQIVYCGPCVALMPDIEYNLHCTTLTHKTNSAKIRPDRFYRDEIDSVLKDLKGS